MTKPENTELYEALDEHGEFIRSIQDILTGCLEPGGYSANEAVERLLYVLDGPKQRKIQRRGLKALAKARGAGS